jgi:hypothetical protein
MLLQLHEWDIHIVCRGADDASGADGTAADVRTTGPVTGLAAVARFSCPEPDQAAETLNDRRDDSIVRERAPDFPG